MWTYYPLSGLNSWTQGSSRWLILNVLTLQHTHPITAAQNLIHSLVITDKSIYMPTYRFATMIAPYERKRERNVELVGLGLPLQGSGWTEYSMHMWRRVCERTHCVRVAPEPDKK